MGGITARGVGRTLYSLGGGTYSSLLLGSDV